jgi:hypothetical protein
MIVRISGGGQYRLPEDVAERLNDLDNQTVAAVDAGDEARFRQLVDRMLDLVRSEGEPLPPDELIGSDVILPPADITLEEAASEFTGEGLVPER